MTKMWAWGAYKKVFKGENLTLWFEDREQRDEFVRRDRAASKCGTKMVEESEVIKMDLVPSAPESEDAE